MAPRIELSPLLTYSFETGKVLLVISMVAFLGWASHSQAIATKEDLEQFSAFRLSVSRRCKDRDSGKCAKGIAPVLIAPSLIAAMKAMPQQQMEHDRREFKHSANCPRFKSVGANGKANLRLSLASALS